jgi:alpha-tubulin suppressor-like RCC1 family protein
LNLAESPTNSYLLKEKEIVLQVACGSIHTLARSNMHRIFSCGNGSTYALGHKNRESCSTFKQIEYFNGNDEGVNGAGIKTIACGLSHSGCVLSDGSVYLWGITGDIQYSKEFMEKCLMKKPTKVSFKNSADANNGNVSHRRRSNV